MTHEWEHYWKKKADEAEHKAHKLAEYPELAAVYEEEAEEIRKTFLAEAVIVEEDPTNGTIEGWDGLKLQELEGLEELEKRYLDGDR